jgi:hypothetical protein
LIDNFSLTVNNKKRIYDPKYNVVSLNCSKKSHRIKLISALRNKERFIYSYYPYEDEDQINVTYNNEKDRLLLNELTELNEIYDQELFMNKNEKDIKERTKEEIIETIAPKHFAFQESVPLEYIQSCMDLVTESYVFESIMLTEKTFKPIVLRKPFLLLSARNSHIFLKKIGYELYDEMFDYSFDDKSFLERFDSIINQITEILKIPLNEFVLRCEDIHDKIEYNYNHQKKAREFWMRAYKNLPDKEYVEFLLNMEINAR